MKADLMILEESFSTLDVYTKEDVIELLIEQLNEKMIVLLSTHDLEEIEQSVACCVFID